MRFGTPIVPAAMAVTLEDVGALTAEFASKRGFPTWLLVCRFNRGGKLYVPRAITNADDRYVDAYERNGWGAVDQVMQRALTEVAPFWYSAHDLATGNKDWRAALRDFGLDRGVVIPFHGPQLQSVILQLNHATFTVRDAGELRELALEAMTFLCGVYPSLEAILRSNFEHEPLSDRERAILTLVAHGKPIKVISSTLSISARTVSNALDAICKKMHVATREQAVGVAVASNDISMVRGRDPDPLMQLKGI